MLYFTSDTHFGDPRVLRIDRRPFPSVAAHDEGLVELWNATVGDGDEIWHLGDFMRGGGKSTDALLARLNGTKHLIIGNNDAPEAIASSGWTSVQHYAELRIDGRLVVMCHYPFRTWNRIGDKSIDLHGHSHGRLKPMTRQYDVGVDARDLRPVTFEELTGRRRI
jgi:calcineurin-like phosphoesterase family protein